MYVDKTVKTPNKRYVILDDIRSAHNVGSIFRTSDGAGIDKVYLCGYTPKPVDRFGRTVASLHKTALGAEQVVPWEDVSDIVELVCKLKKNGVKVVVVEQAPHATSLPNFKTVSGQDVAYVFGNEIDGVQPGVCEIADEVVEILMYGKKESLNVGVSVGVVLFTTHADWS